MSENQKERNKERKKSMVMIYDINLELKDENVRTDLVMCNMRGCEFTDADYSNEFKIKEIKGEVEWKKYG